MTRPDIHQAAIDVVLSHLNADIEFCEVYERDDLADLGNKDHIAIHGEAMRILGNVADHFIGREW
ncbi:hypothetical protein ACFU44_00765 [Nocardia rhizosphaerihabitans]|uniref:hypothetical protein n=1 Tax=Nocardia rhizosphaerihabitans TaxID=1691570 RepID=UPI0036724749